MHLLTESKSNCQEQKILKQIPQRSGEIPIGQGRKNQSNADIDQQNLRG